MVYNGPSYDNFRTFRSLEVAEKVLAQYPIEETDGTWEWKVTAHLAERLNPNTRGSEKGTYFALYEESRGEKRATKHKSFNAAKKSVDGWKAANPLGEASIARELEFEYKLQVKS